MSFVYNKGIQNFMLAAINWRNMAVSVQLIKENSYPISPATLTDVQTTHQYLSDISAAARVGNPQPLGGKDVIDTAASASDVTMTNIGTADGSIRVVGYVIYQNTGVETTSRLIAYIDEPFKNAQGVVTPLATNSGSITLTLSNQTPSLNYIFKL